MKEHIKTALITIILYSLTIALTVLGFGIDGIYQFINVIMPLVTGIALIILGSIYCHEAFGNGKLKRFIKSNLN